MSYGDDVVLDVLLTKAKKLKDENTALRKSIKAYLDLDMDSLEFCRIMRKMGVIE